jgi:hypothetical protein
MDDWGTEHLITAPAVGDRISAGLSAFHAFSPPTRPVPAATALGTTALDQAFAVGCVGGYVLDCRPARGHDPAAPVLGTAQRNRFLAWCQGDALRHDVLVVVAPVPLGFATPISWRRCSGP